MEQFDGNELITIPYAKYRYLLNCKKRVERSDFFISLLEIDDHKLAKKLSQMCVYQNTVKSLANAGIVTVQDLVYYIMSNHPRNMKDIEVMLAKIRGIGIEGARMLYRRIVE